MQRFSIDTRGYEVSLHNSREGDLVLKKKLDAVKKDLWVVVLDIVAVNVSYYLALLIRFFDRATGVNDTAACLAQYG